MTTKISKIRLTISLDLLFKIWKTRKPNQSLNDRFTELIKQGIEIQREINRDAEGIKQLKELIKEGKAQDPLGVFK
jgi:thymidine phosphorylase